MTWRDKMSYLRYCVVPASAVRKIYPVYDEMKATVGDTGKKEKITIK